MKNVTLMRTGIMAIAALAVAACGDSDGTNPYEQAETTNIQEAETSTTFLVQEE